MGGAKVANKMTARSDTTPKMSEVALTKVIYTSNNCLPSTQIRVAIGGKIIAREPVCAFRKDVTAKCYGDDATRKRKLLDRREEGKKRTWQFGKVDIPQEAFIAALKVDV